MTEPRTPPMDFGDWALHIIATIGAAAAASALMRQHEEIAVSLVITVSAIFLSWRRNRVRAAQTSLPLTTGETSALQMQVLEQRVAELEEVQQRVLELEERVDFAERLLARPVGASPELPR